MCRIAARRPISVVIGIAALLAGCGDSASGVDALEGIAAPQGREGARLMDEAERAAANAAARSDASVGALAPADNGQAPVTANRVR